jgi:hypothetical protein
MSDRTDVLDLLATHRPPYFEDPGDLARRRGDLERAISAPLPQGFSSFPPSRAGLLRRSRPLTIGIAAAATVAAVTGGSTALFAKHNATGSPAVVSSALATGTKGQWLVLSTESTSFTQANLNGKNFNLRQVDKRETWLPQQAKKANFTSRTTTIGLADAKAKTIWNAAGSPKEVPTGEVKNGRFVANGTIAVSSTSHENSIHNADYSTGAADHTCAGGDQCTKLYGDPKAAVKRLTASVAKSFEERGTTAETVPDAKDGSTTLPVPDSVHRSNITFNDVRDMIADPAPRATRLALVRQLDVAHVKKIGLVKDTKGRSGMGYISTGGSSKGTRWEERLIIDGKTGTLLADESRYYTSKTTPPKAPSESTVYLGIRWSNATPPRSNQKNADGTQG